jgi:thiol-disulfide isomerase/thioredoxin/uncharacterized membrane protein YphA (DoxX/SURF4 family)
MDIVLLLARLVLAGVFIVAGVAKLVDRRGSTQAMRDFGILTSLAAPFGAALPVAEIAVAIALIPTASARWGALGALILLLAFVAGIGYNLAHGKKPDCHCFGQLHSEPAGWPTLIRNGVLLAVAAFVLFQGWDDSGASTVAWIGDLSAIQSVTVAVAALAVAMLAVVGWGLVQLMQQNGRLLIRLDALETAIETGKPVVPAPAAAKSGAGLPVGAVAPTFDLPDVHGMRMTPDTLRSSGKPVMLIFSDPGCGPCNALLPEIGRWQREHEKGMTLALVTRGDIESNRSKSAEHGIRHVVLQENREVAQAYQASATPSAILVQPDGTIGSPLAMGADAIRGLVAQTVGAPVAVPPLPAPNGQANGSGNGQGLLGTPVPNLELKTLDSDDVSLTSLMGETTALLFWNPGCGFCARMLDDLKEAEANASGGAPRIVLISTGDAERNRAMGLQSTILLDQGFSVGRAFGASGTPSAVLIDADGRVASSVAVGAPAVLSLATGAVPVGA